MRKTAFGRMVRDVWDIGLVTLLALAGLEAWQRGFVSRFFNIHLVVLFLAAVSVILLMTRSPLSERRVRPYAALQAIGLVAAFAAWNLLPEGIRPMWRSVAAGGVLMASLFAWPLINRE